MFSGHRLNTRSVVSQFRDRMNNRTVVASIHDFRKLNEHIAKVVVTYNTKEAPADVMRAALAETLNYRALPIKNSFRWVHSYSLPAVVGFIRKNIDSRPYEEASAKKMKALASNLLMDTEDESLWEVRSGGNGQKMLVRQSPEDLSELLVTASVRQHNAPDLERIYVEANVGDFVAFVNPKTGASNYGYVLSQTDDNVGENRTADSMDVTVFDPVTEDVEDIEHESTEFNAPEEMRGQGNKIAQRLNERNAPVNVGRDYLYDAAYLNGVEAQFEAVAAPKSTNLKTAMNDYYRRLFSYAPDYYEQVRRIIEGRSAM